MLVPVTGLYVVILAAINIWLEMPVGMLRGKTKIPIHDDGNVELRLAIRKHDNFTEHVPFILILLAALELNGGGQGLLHGLGIALVVARIAHPLGLKADTIQSPLRAVGAFGTLAVTVVAMGALGLKLL